LTLVLFLGLGLVFEPAKNVLAAGGAISGVVTDEQGNPLENIGITIYVLDPAGSGAWLIANQTSLVTNAAGAYSVAGLEAGAYRIKFEDTRWPRQFSAEHFDDALKFEDAAAVELIEGATRDAINAQPAAAGQITGHVTDENNTPLENIRVTVYQFRPDLNEWFNLLSVLTDAAGNYQVVGLEPDAYRIEFQHEQQYY
jgi:protocatechuate 3,4-dioxygenase beta subunit